MKMEHLLSEISQFKMYKIINGNEKTKFGVSK
jgi:hypothetical protein